MTLRFVLVWVVGIVMPTGVAGCSVDAAAVAPGPESTPDAALDTGASDPSGPDSAPRDSTVVDSSVDVSDTASDAPPPRRPTAVVTTGDAGGQGSHPAVVWTGSEFVIGLISGGHVELLRMPPGRMRDTLERVTTDAGVDLQDVVLATDGGELAVGWTEDRAGDEALMVRILPTDTAPRVVRGGLYRENDRRDALLYGTGGGFGAIVRDESAAGVQRLQYVDVAVGSPNYLGTSIGSFGELDIRQSPLGPLFVTGRPQGIFRREGSVWVLAAAPVLGEGSEGSVAALVDGAVGSVWLQTPPLATSRVLTFVRHLPGALWRQDGSTVDLAVDGSDPALAPFENGALMAFSYTDGGGRTLGLLALSGEGDLVTGPCRVAPSLPFANDPDVACGGGWCAIAWMEASEYAATDYVTRVIQVPEDHDNLCP